MPRIRRIDMPGCTSGHLGAVTTLLAHEAFEGTFEPTCIVFRWSHERPSISIPPYEDGDALKPDVARAHGHVPGRRILCSGGTGIFTPDLPFISYYHRAPFRKPDRTIHVVADENGEANTLALRRLGFPVEYRTIGDLEVVEGDFRHKVGANTAGNVYLDDFWGTNTAIIWGAPPPASIAAITAATVVPPEKFEDKQTKSFAGRMLPLSDLAARLGLSVTMEDVIDACVEANAHRVGCKPETDAWRPAERDFIERAVPFFEGEIWHQRISSRRLARLAPPDYRIGQAAYKSRKLLKATVVVDDAGRIHDCLFAGDALMRPQPTVTGPGILEELQRVVRGRRVDDEQGLLEALTRVLERPDVEAPLVEPAHFLAPLLRASQRLQPIASFLAPAAQPA